MKIAIGTKNPAKIHAVSDVLIRENVQIVTVDVKSGVAPQPFSDDETMLGALNRARSARDITDATLAFGLEGGVTETSAGLMLCNWGALVHQDGREWIASGAKFLLPDYVTKRLYLKEELGDIMADLSGEKEIRKQDGAVGYFSASWVNRKEMFAHLVRLLYGQYIAAENRFHH